MPVFLVLSLFVILFNVLTLKKTQISNFVFTNIHNFTAKMDDPFVSCPYEPQHRVPRSRIQAHIVKCQKRYPELKICPFNATHRLPEAEIRAHIANCPSRADMFPEVPIKNTGAITTPKPILQREYLPETDPNHEIWDD